MTSKRSRTDFEADKSSSPLRPPFVLYGTPLPPLDSEVRDDGSYVPIWKQEVRDERGRKRLHGAFTGGFSAGYFNTVGSKEGWAPSTFVSSRTKRHTDGASRKAEDLMDDEDLADLQESQKLETDDSFAKLGSTQVDGRPRGALAELFHSSNDSMGVKLLQRMGWKPGQGLGPKVRRNLGGAVGSNASDGQTHLFAPHDVPMISFDRKTDKFGLGWTGEQRLSHGGGKTLRQPLAVNADESDNEGEPSAVRQISAKKVKPKKSSFGVGVLNDTGSDDEDPYEIGPRISYNKVIGGDKKKRKGGLVSSTQPESRKTTSLPRPQIPVGKKGSGFRRCHDGRTALDGFILATQSLRIDDNQRYDVPAIPVGWKSSRTAVEFSSQSNAYTSNAEAAKASNMDPKQRAALLGEAALPGKSIFDFIAPETRNKLAAATGASLPQGKGESAPAGYEETAAQKQRSLWDLVPRIERSTAQAALDRSMGSSAWMPYAEDDGKRARYMSYLSTITGLRNELPARKDGSTVDEWSAEMKEFAQAAMVFRPVSGLMASRFTTAKHDPHKSSAPSTAEVLEGTETIGGLTIAASKQHEKAEDPAEQAAKLGMYGPLTRNSADFYPTRLTCKRFGVQTPAHVLHGPEENEAASQRQKDKYDVVGKDKLDEMRSAAATAAARAAASSSSPATMATNAGSGVADAGTSTAAMLSGPTVRSEVDVERNEALEGKRAGEELFRSIFGDDDDDDDDG